jgi:hypothetical protein
MNAIDSVIVRSTFVEQMTDRPALRNAEIDVRLIKMIHLSFLRIGSRKRRG